MTTFTMQDLQNAVPTTHQQDEEFKQMENIGLKEMFAGMGSDLTGGKSNTFDAPIPQPTLCESTQTDSPTLEDVLQNIAEQFALLYTVIRKEKLQGNSQSQAETKAGENSLQETVGLVLQQADWFKDLIRVELVALDLEKIAEGAVESIVENEVESYFENRFDPSDHFDFGDAVSDCVSDQIDDVVSDKIDDAVDAYLTNATISISK